MLLFKKKRGYTGKWSLAIEIKINYLLMQGTWKKYNENLVYNFKNENCIQSMFISYEKKQLDV